MILQTLWFIIFFSLFTILDISASMYQQIIWNTNNKINLYFFDKYTFLKEWNLCKVINLKQMEGQIDALHFIVTNDVTLIALVCTLYTFKVVNKEWDD